MDEEGQLPTSEDIPILGEDVPVTMPALPSILDITTMLQFKAINDTTRSQILSMIKHRPMTAKQLADELGIPPGTIGHHLQVLEGAGLAKIVARRLMRGIVAKYYTRTARLFNFNLPVEITGETPVALSMATEARDELTQTIEAHGLDPAMVAGFPHARLAPDRAGEFAERLLKLIDEFALEPEAPEGQVYALSCQLFLAPPYLQVPSSPSSEPAEEQP